MNTELLILASVSAGVFIGMVLMAFLKAGSPLFTCACCGDEKEPHACRECMAWVAEQVREGA